MGLIGQRTQSPQGRKSTLISWPGRLEHRTGDSEARSEPGSITINARICHRRGPGSTCARKSHAHPGSRVSTTDSKARRSALCQGP